MAITGFDTSVLLGFYQAKAGVGVSTASSATSNTVRTPTAPWNQPADAKQALKDVKSVMAGHKFINENAAQLDVAGASQDYKKLFALWQGLGTLSELANQANGKNLSTTDKMRLSAVFAKGMAEVSNYLTISKFENLRMTQGALATTAKTSLSVPRTANVYTTAPLVTSTTEPISGLPDDGKFTISVKRLSVTHNVSIDLSEMGSTPRTIGNVIGFINGKLDDAGLETKLSTQRTTTPAKTVTVNGKEVKIGADTTSWAMKVTVGGGETVSFSAPATAGAVYVAQTVGDPNPDKNPTTDDGVTQTQFLKFQTDTDDVGTPPQIAGQANWVEGRTFSKTLGAEVVTVHDTKIGPDGSVYVLADIDEGAGKTEYKAGQSIKGEQDVALMKYDSAGNLLFTQVLGAAGTASGLGLAVSADGKVAVAGSIKGTLNGATNGPLNSGESGSFAENTDSFVTVYDSEGQEIWTARRGARQDDAATQVAFGADGTVYVAGNTKSVMPGSSAIGGQDSYIQAFKPDVDSKGLVQTVFTQQFGAAGLDQAAGMVVDGTNLVTATIEDGRAVLRRFDVSSGTPVLTSTRDLGELQGNIAGLAIDNGKIILAGTTTNAALGGGVSVKNPLSGGADVFAISVAADLAPVASDAITFLGGAGEDKATSLSVSNGQVWVGGSAGDGDFAGKAQIGTNTRDGFIARLDMTTGAAQSVVRFSGKDGRAIPTAIAVDTTGSSVLDRLGLPTGTLDTTPSQRITAVSSLRAGDTFTVRTGQSGPTKTITIEEKDTLDTLATKIKRATGFQAKVSVTASNGARILKIEPQNDRSIIEIGAGKADKDALLALGIPEGAVRATTIDSKGKTVAADGKGGFYGLALDAGLNLDSAEDIKHALADLAAAQNVLRTAYRDLRSAANPQSEQQAAAAGNTSGTVPAYLNSQIANYQAALARLSGGDSSGMSSLLG